MTELHRLETFSYFCIWTVGVLYSIYQVYRIGNSIEQNTHYNDFSLGWPVTSRMKDISDFEWNSMFPFLYSLQPWFYLHALLNEIFRWKYRQCLVYTSFLVTSICITYFYGSLVWLIFIIQPVTFYIILQFKCKIFIWLICILFLAVLNMHPVTFFKEILEMPDHSQYLISVTLSWIHLRCISFCLEKLMVNDIENGSWNADLISLLSYVFYLPLLFFGPVMLYKDFHLGASRPFKEWKKQLIMSFAFNIFRYYWWAIFHEVSLHYIYSSALSYQPEVVYGMDSWTLFGFGYCMGQLFMTKYTILYGIPATFSRLDHLNPPPHPKCIGRIHLYSDMWKYFDIGLYSFLIRYIYIPVCGKARHLRRKLCASFLCFVFVYVWHGTSEYILVWAALNFFGITIEGIAKTIYMTPSYQLWEGKVFSARGSRRFHALIASPLLMMSALSNFYFFGGMEVGNIFVQKILEGWNGVTVVVIAFLYCCSQVSIDVKDWETKRINLRK